MLYCTTWSLLHFQGIFRNLPRLLTQCILDIAFMFDAYSFKLYAYVYSGVMVPIFAKLGVLVPIFANSGVLVPIFANSGVMVLANSGAMVPIFANFPDIQ